MADLISSSRLFQFLRQASPAPVAVPAPVPAAVYGVDSWQPGALAAPPPPPLPPPLPPLPPPPPPLPPPPPSALPPIDLASVMPQLVKGAQRLLNASDEFYVKELFRTLLGREPDAKGLQTHMASLKNGMTHDQLRQAFLAGDEYKSKLNAPAAPAPAPAQVAGDAID
ncbi:MAG: hypothetical protein JWM80_1814 [Cyanobacteria bacterium RYN_339]|nr:hypothetical protein [Cyanobacteria bacterium RYN_339]